MSRIIHIAAALLINTNGQTLLIRKRGTQAFMQPGGKIEAHELPAQALVRELKEELGIVIDPLTAQYLGTFSAPAANEPDHQVHCELFRVSTDETVRPAAEIEEAVWVDHLTARQLNLAPLTRDQVLALHF